MRHCRQCIFGIWRLQNRGMVWFGRVLWRFSPPDPLQWSGTSPTRSTCSDPWPTWPWMFPGMGAWLLGKKGRKHRKQDKKKQDSLTPNNLKHAEWDHKKETKRAQAEPNRKLAVVRRSSKMGGGGTSCRYWESQQKGFTFISTICTALQIFKRIWTTQKWVHFAHMSL